MTMISLMEVKEEQHNHIAMFINEKHYFVDIDTPDYDIFRAFDTLEEALEYLCFKLVKLPDFSLNQLLESGYIEWR